MNIRGEYCADILSAEEAARIKKNPPESIEAYMQRYVEGLKARPIHPNRWVKATTLPSVDEPDVDETLDDTPTEDGIPEEPEEIEIPTETEEDIPMEAE